ncbi:MAG: hypothetical protein CMJ54_00275 [Planctomycetaceae bacterium]|nr:hypothetical protein [Planctomycetaceae bacterium]
MLRRTIPCGLMYANLVRGVPRSAVHFCKPFNSSVEIGFTGVDSKPRSRAHRSAVGNHDLRSGKADPTRPASTGERPRSVFKSKRTACRGEPLALEPTSFAGRRSLSR